MNKIRIFLDGVDYTKLSNFDEYVVELERDGSSQTATILSTNSITFFKEAYDFLYTEVVLGGRDVSMQIVTSCFGGTDDTYTIQPNTIREFKPDICQIEAYGVIKGGDQESLKRLKTKVFWEGPNGVSDLSFLQTSRPLIGTCAERNLFHQALATLLIAIPIIGALVASALRGCGRQTPAFFLHTITQNIADICGLTLNDTFFNSQDWERASMVFTSPKKASASNVTYIEENMPIETCDELLDSLKDTFNMDYRIKNSNLIIRGAEDFKRSLAGVSLINVHEAFAEGLAEVPATFNTVDIERPDRINLSYQEAFMNVDAEAITAYNDLYIFPGATNDRSRKVTISNNFTPNVFVGDQFYSNPWPINQTNGYLLLTRHLSSGNKLIYLESASAANGQIANVISRPAAGGETHYNYKLYFNKDYPEPELIQLRHEDKNNWPGPDRNFYTLSEFEFLADADHIQLMRTHDLDVDIETDYGVGVPTKASINYSSGTIKVQDVDLVN